MSCVHQAIEVVRNAALRGVTFELVNGSLCVRPPKNGRLVSGEVEIYLAHEEAIRSLFESGRLRLIDCPGDGCDRILCVIDCEAWCSFHRMSVRFEGLCA